MERQLGFGEMSDADFVEAFENCAFPPGDFHHADHVRLAWIYVKRYGLAAAEEKSLTGIWNLAIHAGAPQKFLYTTTVAWVRLVAAALKDASPTQPFEEWIAANPQLLKRELLELHYSKGKLASPEARSGWVEPDLNALPS